MHTKYLDVLCDAYSEFILSFTRIGAVSGNVPILATVVARLVSSGFGAVSTNVAHFSTVEATPEAGTFLVDGLAVSSFSTRIGAFTGKVTRSSTVVALLGAAVLGAFISVLSRHPSE